MNTGIFGEGFPYSNFHDLNMDWIIKIAKDFLDQYTHIQEIIEQGKTDIQNLTDSGLEQLQEKYDTLQGLLDAWYNEHSADIANQLADALADLNEWYTTHENYLNDTLATNTALFNARAEAKAQEVIESIPDNYTALSNHVESIQTELNQNLPLKVDKQFNWSVVTPIEHTSGRFNKTTGNIDASSVYYHDIYAISLGQIYAITATAFSNTDYPAITLLDSNDTILDIPFPNDTGENVGYDPIVYVIDNPNATKMILNGNRFVKARLGSEIPIYDELEYLDKLKADAEFTWETAVYTNRATGRYNVNTGNIDASSVFYHSEYSVSKGQVYSIIATSFANLNYPAIVLLDSNDNVIAIPYVNTTGEDEGLDPYVFAITRDDVNKMIINGNAYARASIGTKFSTIDKMNTQTNSNFANFLKVIGTTPMVTWIDDDGDVENINSILKPILDELNIPVTFAVIAPFSNDPIVIGNETTTALEYFKTMQENGNHIASHPSHYYWYGEHQNIAQAEKTLVQCLSYLQTNGFIHSDAFIYPGTSVSTPSIVEMVKKWVLCAVKAGYFNANHLGDRDRYNIGRMAINFASVYEDHHSDTGFTSAMDWYKAKVDELLTTGDWLVFGTHSYDFTNSDSTADPNANTRGNLKALLEYVKDSNIPVYTLWDAFNRRRYLFDFKEMNK